MEMRNIIKQMTKKEKADFFKALGGTIVMLTAVYCVYCVWLPIMFTK